jgi:hypothetical protein
MRPFRIAITLVLAAIVALFARKLASVSVERAPERSTLLAADAIDPERIDLVEIVRGDVLHRFERRADGWWQTEPIVHAADSWSMRQLAQRALKVESVRRVELSTDESPDAAAQTLAGAGLAPPAGRFRLSETGADARPAKTVEIELGRRGLAGRAFARVVTGGIATREAQAAHSFDVIDGTLHEFALERAATEYRRKELFPTVSEIDRVELAAGAATIAVVRRGRTFSVEAPIKTRADREACAELFDAIKRARSAAFVIDAPSDLSVYGLSPPAATLRVSGPNGDGVLAIGAPVAMGSQDRFALVEGTTSVVRVPATTLAGIAPRADRLIDATATDARPSDVGAIDIRLGDTLLAIRREVDGWRATETAPDGAMREGSVDLSAVERLLSALDATRATAIEIAAFPVERERAIVTLRGFAGEVIETVRVASDRAGGGTGDGLLLENGDGVLRRHGAIDFPVTAEDLGFAPRS